MGGLVAAVRGEQGREEAVRVAGGASSRSRIYIHVGRAQYKLLDAPVLIQDVTFVLRSTLGAIDPLSNAGRGAGGRSEGREGARGGCRAG